MTGLAEYWRLTLGQESALLGVPEATLSEWFANPERARVPREQQQRVILLCEIYSHLHSFYADQPAADEWPHRANSAFDGRTPMMRMLDGLDGLRDVAMHTQGMAGEPSLADFLKSSPPFNIPERDKSDLTREIDL